ncbi:MAG: ankyrin repeat domain-containing protein [Bdellovibrionales bacterium]|nr:ankyrin repeat domain-containing protein [Bdellovibrionales bacterium]
MRDQHQNVSVALKVALHSISENRDLDLKLLLKMGLKPESRDSSGMTLLHRAVLARSKSMVRNLLDFGSQVNDLDQDGRTALLFSIVTGEMEISDFLIQEGADTNLGKCLPLVMAVFRGNLDAAELLLESGADPNRSDENKVFPLDLAIAVENHSMAELLREYGAVSAHPAQ